MEKKVKILENIVEVEFYLNSIVSKSDFFKEVNNIIISALKIDYSTIYLIENDKYVFDDTVKSPGRRMYRPDRNCRIFASDVLYRVPWNAVSRSTGTEFCGIYDFGNPWFGELS